MTKVIRKFFDGGADAGAAPAPEAGGPAPGPADLSTMTPDQARAKGRELTVAADREADTFKRRQLNAEAQRHFELATGGRIVGAPVDPKPAAQQQGPRPNAAPAPISGPIGREQGEALLKESTGGALTYDQVDTICRDAGPWSRNLQEIAATKGEGARQAAIEQGEADVVRTLYRGNTSAMREGLLDIVGAIKGTFGDKADAIIQIIDENAALADSRTHEQVLTWARAILKSNKQ
jgi:hypothetical protein